MKTKQTRTCRFNFVMTESEKENLDFLLLCFKEEHGHGTTKGDIVRRLISAEVHKFNTNPPKRDLSKNYMYLVTRIKGNN